ncbi:putative NBPF family member NBPF5 [Equus asinus]|uniref:putative NBPF family member NBPF5 n=1 Tax=Equus asinus TaxID=9793 RepID=UPI0038F6CFC2
MAVCPHALSDPRAEVTLQESNQELRSQLAQSKQDFQALMEEFLVSEAAAYSLATELQKHKCGECKDIIESVLGDKLPFEEGKLAEKSALAEKLRESNLLIQEQEQQLAYLRHKLQEGREVWALLSQHLNDLLTHDGSDDHQGQAFRQQLAEGYRLAKHLAHILGPAEDACLPLPGCRSHGGGYFPAKTVIRDQSPHHAPIGTKIHPKAQLSLRLPSCQSQFTLGCFAYALPTLSNTIHATLLLF